MVWQAQGERGAASKGTHASPSSDPQDSGYSGGADRPGGVDRAGPQPRHARRERHALGLPAVAPGAVGAVAARLGAAAHVGASDPTRVAGRAPDSRPHPVTPRSALRGRTFRGATVGLAPVEGMCRAESSGGVSTVSRRPGGGPGRAAPAPAVTPTRPPRTTRSSRSALRLPWPTRSATAWASATTPTAAARRPRRSRAAASWPRPRGKRGAGARDPGSFLRVLLWLSLRFSFVKWGWWRLPILMVVYEASMEETQVKWILLSMKILAII